MCSLPKIQSIHNRSGMALVMALLAISLLTAITVQLFTKVNWQIKASTNFRDNVRLDALNRSALSIARAALLADQNADSHDSLHDEWNLLSEKDLHSLLGSDQLSVIVTDLSGKLQDNALVSTDKNNNKRVEQEKIQYDLWLRFLTSGRFAVDDVQEAEALLDAIRDWIDSDGNERDDGAEEGYYLSRDNPYSPRNAPIQTLEELLLVRGMTKDLFYGNEDYPGIIEYLTEYGSDGKININSALPPILQNLAAGLDDEMVQGLLEYRENEDNKDKLDNPGWYRQVSVIPGYIDLGKDLISIKSSYFRIASTVQINELSRTGSAVVFRDDNGAQKLLRWDVE